MKKIIIAFFLLLLIFSCGQKKNKKLENNSNSKVKTEAVGKQDLNITEITELGQSMLDENKINSDQENDQIRIQQAKQAAENGDVQAMIALSAFYYQNGDKKETLKWLIMAGEKGDNDAIRNLIILNRELGNEKESLKWSQKYAINTNDKAMLAGIGGMYLEKKNLSEAKKWFERAYDAGEKRVDINIAQINAQQKNNAEALKWYKRVAARGETRANTYIGYIYLDKNNNSEARTYLIKGYNAGSKEAALAIAETYRREQDLEGMKKWYGIAAANGDKQAKKALASINSASDNNLLFNSPIENTLHLSGSNAENPKATVELGEKKSTKLENTNSNETIKVDYSPQEKKVKKYDPNDMFNMDNN